MRRTAIEPPRHAPWVATAACVYSEQLGAKRQDGGITGRKTTWYARMNARIIRAATPRASGLAEAEGTVKLCGCCRMSDLTGCRFGDHDEVGRRLDPAPRAAYDLAHDPFDAVADDGIADALAHRNADPRDAGFGRSGQQHEVRRVLASAAFLDAHVLTTLSEPRVLGKTGRPASAHPGCLGGIDAVSRLRPFARRRFSTLRPPGVAMRARNPCVRLRRRLLG